MVTDSPAGKPKGKLGHGPLVPQKVNYKLRVVLEVTAWRMQAGWAVGLCGDKGCGDWLVLESVDPRGLTREQPSCTCCAGVMSS